MRGADGTLILLAHDPRRLTEAAASKIPLVLSGHTHGGQVVLPGIGADRRAEVSGRGGIGAARAHDDVRQPRGRHGLRAGPDQLPAGSGGADPQTTVAAGVVKSEPFPFICAVRTGGLPTVQLKAQLKPTRKPGAVFDRLQPFQLVSRLRPSRLSGRRSVQSCSHNREGVLEGDATSCRRFAIRFEPAVNGVSGIEPAAIDCGEAGVFQPDEMVESAEGRSPGSGNR